MIETILEERQTTHGHFADNAQVSQALKEIMRDTTRYTPIQAEAIDMICLKLSRIASNPDVKDHWDDIAGYATLAANDL